MCGPHRVNAPAGPAGARTFGTRLSGINSFRAPACGISFRMQRHSFLVRLSLVLALTTCGPITGCAPEAADFGEGEEAPPGAEIRATLGPDGGVLEGLDGFRLVIPAGALAAETEIVVRPTVDPTPLAQTAERVGPAFALLPEDLVLAVPAEVTVPLDPELRSAWDVPDTDCRVWQRTAEAWERREQTASSPESVTVAIERLSTLAAGVLRAPRTPTCTTGSCGTIERLDDRTCFAGTTMCMERVGGLPHMPLDTASLSVDGGSVYYLFSRATNTFNVAAFSLDSFRAPVVYTELVAAPTAPVGNIGRLHVGAGGEVWASLTGVGNVRFRPTSVPARFDTGVVSSPAGVVIEEANRANVVRLNRLVLGTEALYTGITPTGSWDIARLSSADALRARAIGTGSTSLADPFQFFATRSGEGVFGTRRAASARTDVCGNALTVNADAGLSASGSRDFWVACSDRRVFLNGILVGTSPSTIGSFALDRTEGVAYATDPSRAELVVFGLTSTESGYGVRTVALTDAAPDSPEYARMLPRAIRYDASRDEVVLITAGMGTPEVWTISPQDLFLNF